MTFDPDEHKSQDPPPTVTTHERARNYAMTQVDKAFQKRDGLKRKLLKVTRGHNRRDHKWKGAGGQPGRESNAN